MRRLDGSQRKFLKGLAHGLKPVVQVGQKGVGDPVIRSVDQALTRHELIKVKFLECGDRGVKRALAERVAQSTGSEMVGMIGHTAIFFRQNSDPQKRRIRIPEGDAEGQDNPRPAGEGQSLGERGPEKERSP